jgi:hypothetical protein
MLSNQIFQTSMLIETGFSPVKSTDYFRIADSSETIRKTLRLGWFFFLSAACFMISGVVLFRLNIAEKSFA